MTQAFVVLSGQIEGKDPRFDLEPDHRPDAPRIPRLNSPVDHHETYSALLLMAFSAADALSITNLTNNGEQL